MHVLLRRDEGGIFGNISDVIVATEEGLAALPALSAVPAFEGGALARRMDEEAGNAAIRRKVQDELSSGDVHLERAREQLGLDIFLPRAVAPAVFGLFVLVPEIEDVVFVHNFLDELFTVGLNDDGACGVEAADSGCMGTIYGAHVADEENDLIASLRQVHVKGVRAATEDKIAPEVVGDGEFAALIVPGGSMAIVELAARLPAVAALRGVRCLFAHASAAGPDGRLSRAHVELEFAGCAGRGGAGEDSRQHD